MAGPGFLKECQSWENSEMVPPGKENLGKPQKKSKGVTISLQEVGTPITSFLC